MKKEKREGKGGSRAQGRANEQMRERNSQIRERGGGRGAGSPGTSLARKTRSQMERRTRSQVKGGNAARGTIVE